VCEAHSVAGGAAHCWERRGCAFDSGTALFFGLPAAAPSGGGATAGAGAAAAHEELARGAAAGSAVAAAAGAGGAPSSGGCGDNPLAVVLGLVGEALDLIPYGLERTRLVFPQGQFDAQARRAGGFFGGGLVGRWQGPWLGCVAGGQDGRSRAPRHATVLSPLGQTPADRLQAVPRRRAQPVGAARGGRVGAAAAALQVGTGGRAGGAAAATAGEDRTRGPVAPADPRPCPSLFPPPPQRPRIGGGRDEPGRRALRCGRRAGGGAAAAGQVRQIPGYAAAANGARGEGRPRGGALPARACLPCRPRIHAAALLAPANPVHLPRPPLRQVTFRQLVESVVTNPGLLDFLDVLCMGTSGAPAAGVPSAYMVRAFAEMYAPNGRRLGGGGLVAGGGLRRGGKRGLRTGEELADCGARRQRPAAPRPAPRPAPPPQRAQARSCSGRAAGRRRSRTRSWPRCAAAAASCCCARPSRAC
jgi:hypothetical protein